MINMRTLEVVLELGRGQRKFVDKLAGESQGCFKNTMVGTGELEGILLGPQNCGT